MFIYTAFLIGLVGSLHCIGMCGPIAIALPLGNKGWLHRVAGGVTYNLGRIITYALLGAVFGLLGQGIEMAGLQRWASIVIGAAMVLSVFFPMLFKGKARLEQFLFGYAGRMISKFRKLFTINSLPSLFLIGLLNGLLPCGLVYVAIAGALNTNDLLNGVLFMAIFGLGTLPVMLAIPLLGNLIGTGIRKRYNHVLSTIVVLIGLLFILRGMSLGIPYISPPQKMLKPHEKMMMHDGDKQADKTMKMKRN